MTDLITDEEILQLPEDSVEAFLAFQKIVEGRLNELIDGFGSDVDRELWLRKYMTLVIEAANEFEIASLQGWKLPDFSKSDSHSYRPFREAVDTCVASFRLKRLRRSKRFSVALDEPSKEKLRHLLKQVRDAVSKLDISVAKKDRLFRCINDLQNEIDLERTRFQVFGALFVELCDDVGEAATRLHPIVGMVERIGAALGYSKRKEEEQAHLPKSEETKRIAGPKERDRIDEEIPF